MLSSVDKDSFSFSEVKTQFENTLKQTLESFGTKTPLRDACEYALMNGGKRIRPLIVFMTAKALNKQFDVSNAALSIEYFHTASLIADDLPCMDNDDFRRDKPSLHKIFGEATALLASYALITAAFEKIYENAKQHKKQAGEFCLIALLEASKAAGIHGATGGQYLDLYPGKLSLRAIKTIIEKKTIRLFEVAFLYGWLFGGGDSSYISEIKKLGYHFGMAFQIADDLRDCLEDQKRNNPANLALYLGKEKAVSIFEQEREGFDLLLDKLDIKTQAFITLSKKLEEHAKGS